MSLSGAERALGGLQTKKLKWKDHPKREHFELRWIGQSVIAGEHPDKLLSNGYYFEEGHSPKDVEIAAVPDWFGVFQGVPAQGADRYWKTSNGRDSH